MRLQLFGGIMNKYKYTIEDIEKVREDITRILEENKDKIPKYNTFPRIPMTECFLYATNPNGIEHGFIKPTIPKVYIRTNHAKKAGYVIDNNSMEIIQLQDIDGDFLDYLWDIRTLQFKPINPNCNLDRLMKYTETMRDNIKKSFETNEEDDIIKALKGDKSWVYRYKNHKKR